jgi:deazaflavin-dependent oxidoreductase (nitroreductase family)
MLAQLAILVGVSIVGLVLIALAFLLGMRTKSPLVLKPLIRLQRAVINPRQMRSAGTPGAYAAVIRHRGRVSGQSYETPVGVVAEDNGYLIALVYGPRTNWLQNVLASGSASIVHDGQTVRVDRPELVPMQDVAAQFTSSDQQGFRLLGVHRALRVRIAEPRGDLPELTDAPSSEEATDKAHTMDRDLRAKDCEAALAV